MRRFLVILIALLFLSSCLSEDERNLRSMMSRELAVADAEKISLSKGKDIGEDYLEQELCMNRAYVEDVKVIVENSFQTQYEAFADNELGLIGTYAMAFRHLFMSEQRWNEDMALKSQRYFSPINTEGEILARFEQYKTDILAIRSHFVESESTLDPEFSFVALPDSDVSLQALHSYSRNNLLIDISSELLDWLLGLLIAAVLAAFSVKHTKLIGGIVSILLIGVSIILGVKNDNKLEQLLIEHNEKAIEIQDNLLLTQLDENTRTFYHEINNIACDGTRSTALPDIL